MLINFTKMNSQGNNFMLVDLVKEKLILSEDDIHKIIQKSEDNFDQLLLINFEFNSNSIYCQIYNSDGSKAYQCGNGLRAIMLYLNEKYNYSKIVVDIENVKYSVTINDQKEITASMGESRSFRLIDNNVHYQNSLERQNILIDSIKKSVGFYLIDLGNKHCVIVDQFDNYEKSIITNFFDNYYSNLLNLEFVDNPKDLFDFNCGHFTINVYEAGAGWTKSCGSGATAVASLFYEIHGAQVCDKLIFIKQKGGELTIKKKNKNLLLIGPSTIEFEGKLNV